ncbi:hypothetical protein CK203_094464 [Vitis vinifera]|uniref:Uncharacterized protein n=1 Tax=Vitis vinifera TaxID=29760 RepID=A0A438E9N8_VITVI|nr:hypothetical protein CK203_094464 [Vitis vinifera]
MVHAKPSSTPMALGQKLALEDSAHFPNVTLYRSTIGSHNIIGVLVNVSCAMLVVPALLVYLSDLLLDLHLKASRMRIGSLQGPVLNPSIERWLVLLWN